MKRNSPIIIEPQANGFTIREAPRSPDQGYSVEALVFETKAGLIQYLNNHFREALSANDLLDYEKRSEDEK